MDLALARLVSIIPAFLPVEGKSDAAASLGTKNTSQNYRVGDSILGNRDSDKEFWVVVDKQKVTILGNIRWSIWSIKRVLRVILPLTWALVWPELESCVQFYCP